VRRDRHLDTAIVSVTRPRLPAGWWLLAALGMAACVDLNGNQDVTLWDATLTAAAGHAELTGQAAAVSQNTGTDFGIGISGAQPAAEHVWTARAGSCAEPGEQIGVAIDYPVLSVSSTGSASAETHLAAHLRRDGTYHVAVQLSGSDTTRIACGDLVVR
jgi:hypothetical protein